MLSTDAYISALLPRQIKAGLSLFSFCAMMIAKTRPRGCLRWWMMIGKREDKSGFVEVNQK
jgi:hypothetical protein